MRRQAELPNVRGLSQSSIGFLMEGLNNKWTDWKMSFETFATIGTVGTTVATYLTLVLAEAIGSFEIGIIEKFGGAGLAGVLAYVLIRWLFKRHDALQNKVEEMHKERLDAQKKHYEELKEILLKNKSE